jgi:hypothetical protein
MDRVINMDFSGTNEIKVPFQPVTSAIASSTSQGSPQPAPAAPAGTPPGTGAA